MADLEAETKRLRAEIAPQNNMVGSTRMESIYRFIGRWFHDLDGAGRASGRKELRGRTIRTAHGRAARSWR
ncbi:MAG: hypothetical protein R2729_11415 [Bryobacteraceae bacterium]